MTLTQEQCKAYYFAARKKVTVYEQTTHESLSVSCKELFELRGKFVIDGKNAIVDAGLLVVE